MFQYEFEKPRRSERARAYPTTSDRSRVYPSGSESGRSSAASVPSNYSRRALPLPPRSSVICSRVPSKNTVPLKVWIIASASCFAVCAVLVLATVVITKWGTTETYTHRGHYYDEQNVEDQPFSYPHIFPKTVKQTKPTTTTESVDTTTAEPENMDDLPILEKLPIFKNMVAKNRLKDPNNKKHDLLSRPQVHPAHDPTVIHAERKIEKKDHAKLSIVDNEIVPEFKPTLPEVFLDPKQMVPANSYTADVRKYPEYEDEYYNDDNLYSDYMQSNSMTSYLIEKVQELHDWIRTDADFDVVNNASAKLNNNPGTQFSQLLTALNESLIEGNVTIVMNKLKDIYFGDNYTTANHSRKVILSNSTDLLSFGILSLDVMLLHNIQLMAWENQEGARNKMLKDPEVFAFNALFLDASKVEAKYNEIYKHENPSAHNKRPTLRQEVEDFDIGKNLLENVLEIGMSTARAAIHLGRAYKNTKMILNQFSNRDSVNSNVQSQLSRNIDANTNALNHLQTSFNKNDTSSIANATNGIYTELDCVWLLYCKNLVATSKLNAPYGVMARINGMALRMLTGELPADKALDTMLYEALTGWSELKCSTLFPRCSKTNAAAVVMESILQPHRKSSTPNKS